MGASAQYDGEVSSLSGFVRVRPAISLGKRFFFEPSLGFVVPWRTNVDGSTKVFPVQIDLDLSVPVLSFLALRLGPGIYSQIIYGSGGVVSLNNGDSVSNFYAPDGTSLSFTFTTQVGIELLLSQVVSINFDLYALDFMSQSRRTFQGSATLGIKL